MNSKLIVLIIKVVSIVAVAVVVGVIPFGIVHQAKTMVGPFEKQITYPEIKVTVNVHPFVILWQVAKMHSVRHINQHITNIAKETEELPVVAIVLVMIVHKYRRMVIEITNYMSVMVMTVVVLMVPVRVWMIRMVIVAPAAVVPPVTLPASVPVPLLVVIIVAVILFVIVIVIHFSGAVFL